jgi:List-Bact-rpt repeat protein/BACON domain-containing protein
LFCVIVSLFILTDLVSGQGAQRPAPLPSSPSLPAAKPEAVPQVACRYAISPASQSVTSAEETGSISVTTTDNCSWTARSGAPWITVGTEASGTGNGMITYSVAANQAAAARTGMITIAGQVFQLTQAAPPQYTLTMSRAGSGQGKVSSNPAGNAFKRGTWVALRAVPDDNSVFASWSGACSGTSTSCNLQMTSDRTVTATFTLKTYTIRVPAPINGVIHPSGTIKVAHGEKRRFQVIPLPGYRVADVLVDKASVGAVNLYTFENVRADHVLEAVFVRQ